MEGLVTEYDFQAVTLRNGEIHLVDTLTELETLQIDQLGEMEAFVTSGGTSTAPYTLKGRVPNYEYKTIRHPGHCERIKIFKDFGFWGKVFLILPALDAGLYALVVVTVINAAISAGYYLRIVGAMFLYPSPDEASAPASLLRSTPVSVAIGISVAGSLLFGTLPQAVELLHSQAVTAAVIETESTLPFDESASLDPR